jgi:UDP-GlcNAc:undecaprenyl-phosphate GlcNAc-1-phosphate transferase
MAERLVQFVPVFLLIAGLASWALAFITRRIALHLKAVDVPRKERKQHKGATPQFGGLGVGLATLFIIGLAAVLFGSADAWLGSRSIQNAQILGFSLGLAILMIGGALDDLFDLKPAIQILFPLGAALAVMMTGTHILQVTDWGTGGAYSLVWDEWKLGALSFLWPADALTLLWLLAVTYATKFLDGLDGLVSGQAVIGSGLIAGLALSAAYFQPEVAVLAVIVGAAFLGFLPHNMTPAKQFLGESGSTIAGFSLAFLAMLGGAKLATAFMAIGLPLVDAGVVVTGRLLRGVSPFRGDRTHLHFKLLRLGFSQKQAVYIMWSLSLLFGLAAFGLQSRGKVFLIISIILLTIGLSLYTGMKIRRRET